MKASPRPASSSSAAPESRMELIEFGAVPVLRYLWPESDELNAALRRVVLAKMASSQGLVDSNEGGWHSARDLATWRS